MPTTLGTPRYAGLMRWAQIGGITPGARPGPASPLAWWTGRVASVDPRRFVPRTDSVLADPRLAAAAQRLGKARVKAAVTEAQRQARMGKITPAEVTEVAVAALPARTSSLTPVLNATGVLLHTNLGRAPLSMAAREAVLGAAGCTDLEFDLASGARTRRGRGMLAALAAAVPAAEAVHVVNNNAAALVLAATALAARPAAPGGREIVISRGELIEIGDRFRLPELLESTGARIREVGTTNRTTLADYAAAVGPETAFVLKVHPSNYRIEGFTADVSVAELAGLPVPVVGDIGSGLLARHPLLPDEPDAGSWLRAGAALVTASGDKLLGGPQAGLILGRADLVERLARHPLARALRVDKLTIAALEATLAGPPAPVASALAAGQASLADRAHRLAARLAGAGLDACAVASSAAVGGGGAPGVVLPSAAVSLPAWLAEPLRAGEPVLSGQAPAVVGRAEGGRLLLDLHSVPPGEDDVLAAAVIAAATRPGETSPGQTSPGETPPERTG
jgi:L-seryl-tRNA(Ser) seleniumtransferase